MCNSRLGFGAALILLAWTGSARGQENITGALLDKLTMLETRIQELENGPRTVQAPFKVVDEQGNVLLSVEAIGTVATLTVGSAEQGMVRLMAEGNAGRVAVAGQSGQSLLTLISDPDGVQIQSKSEGLNLLTLGDPTKTMARLSADKDEATLVAASQKGENIALLNAGQKGAECAAKDKTIFAQLGSSSEGIGGLVISETTGNKLLGEIAVRPSKKLALRLYNDAGAAVVTAGTNPAAGGAGTIRVANVKGENVAFVGTSENGADGAMGVAKNNKNTAVLLSEPRMIALYNDQGNAILTLAKSQEGSGEGGNITLRQPDGEGIFSAGYNAEVGGGDACVYRAKRQNIFCLGIGTPGMGVAGR